MELHWRPIGRKENAVLFPLDDYKVCSIVPIVGGNETGTHLQDKLAMPIANLGVA